MYDSTEIVEAKLLAGNTGYDVVVHSVAYSARLIPIGVYLPLDKNKLSLWDNLDAWVGLLNNKGIINNALIALGVIDQPMRLIYNDFAVYIGIDSFMPYFPLVPFDPNLIMMLSGFLIVKSRGK